MKKIFIIILCGATVFFGGLFVVYTLISDKIIVLEEAILGQDEPVIKEVEPVGQMLKLDDFVVNLADRETKRYLRVGITLEVKTNSAAEEVQKRLPQVRDAIIVILSSKQSDELEGVVGKDTLRKSLLTRINDVLVIGKVHNLYFTDFVIQ